MALTVVWEKCSVDRPDGKGGSTNVILNRGEALPDYVSDFVRTTLTMVGAVRDFAIPVTTIENAVAEQTNTEQPAPAMLPPEVPPVQPVAGTPGATEPVPVPSADPAFDLPRPATSDNKAAWEQYAVAKGYLTQGEAESMTKTKLVDAVNEREQV